MSPSQVRPRDRAPARDRPSAYTGRAMPDTSPSAAEFHPLNVNFVWRFASRRARSLARTDRPAESKNILHLKRRNCNAPELHHKFDGTGGLDQGRSDCQYPLSYGSIRFLEMAQRPAHGAVASGASRSTPSISSAVRVDEEIRISDFRKSRK